MSSNNISLVVENNLCNGCCNCISACSANNICILFNKKAGHPIPLVSEESCTSCGDCLRFCKQAALLKLQVAT